MYNCMSNFYVDQQGRVIILNIKIGEQDITLVAIYAPNVDSSAFFREIEVNLTHRYEHKILIGDFNLTLDPELDRINTYCNNNRPRNS